jgi:hypothetical protein
MKSKCLAVGIILLFVGIAYMPGITANLNDTSGRFEKNDSDIYFFAFAFIEGNYENCWKWFDYFKIWTNSTNTINVLGYSNYQGKFIYVKAGYIVGGFRVGFIGRHHCCIFAGDWFGVTVASY